MENLAALGWTFDGAATNYSRAPAGKDVIGTRREEAGERACSGGLTASQPPTMPRVSCRNSGCPMQRVWSLGRRGWTGSDSNTPVTSLTFHSTSSPPPPISLASDLAAGWLASRTQSGVRLDGETLLPPYHGKGGRTQ